jgi:PAS domain S-box-containing protein
MREVRQPSTNHRLGLACRLPTGTGIVCLLLTLVLLLLGGGISLANEPPSSESLTTVPLVVSSASVYDYPPYALVAPDNQADGFSVELLRAALKAMGRDVSFEIGPWRDVKQMLVDGKVEVLPLVGRTPEREQDFDFTFPYLTMHDTIVVRDTETGIRSLADLKGKQLAVLHGDNAEEFLHRSDLEATIVTTGTYDDALQQLASGQHDAVVVQKLVALQLINRLQLTNLKTVGPPLEDFVQSFCFAVKKGDQKLLALLNEGLATVIADGTFLELRNKWFGPIEAFETDKSRIVIGGDDSYPPYEFLDENGQPAGYNVDLTRAVARQLGMEVDIQLRPWAEIRAGLESEEIDAVQGMFYSKERDRYFDFTPAHTLLSHVIAVREGSEPPASMADLAGRSILVMAGDIMHDAAVKQGYAHQLVLVTSQEEALKQLANGQYDCALVAKVPALYWINQHGWKNLRLGEQPVLSAEYCFAVPHNNRALLTRLSSGLSAIAATGEYREIYTRWLGVYEQPALALWDVLKYASYIIVPLIIILLGSVLWSWSLKHKVMVATANLRQLFDGATYGIALADPHSGILIDCNDAFAEMLGRDKQDIIGRQQQFHAPQGASWGLTGNAHEQLDEKSPQSLIAKMMKASGDIIDVEIKSTLVDLGDKQCLQGFFKDVTREINAGKVLRESENKTRLILNSAAEAIYGVDRDGSCTFCNQSCLDILGYHSELDLLGRNMHKVIHHSLIDGAPRPVENCRIYAAFKTGEKIHIDDEVLWRADGTCFPTEYWSHVILDNDEVVGAVVTFIDISKRKHAEEGLRRALNFTEVLLEQSPMGIRVFEGDSGICIKINQAAVSITGGQSEILLRQNFRELKSWQNAGLTSVAEKVLTDGVARQVEADMVNSFGKTLSVRYFFARFFAEKQPHLLTIGQDISEERQLTAQKQQMEEKMLQAQKLESLGILAGGIAHDFNNILMAVTGHADLALLRLSTESPAFQNLQQIQIATRKAADLAGQMLAYSGKGRFVIESLDLNRVVEEMTHMLEVSISKKARMHFNFSANLPAVEADATQLRQVIMNLIINASEALGEKSGVIAVSTGVVNCDRDCLHESWFDDNLSEGLYVYFEVTDTGCGMNTETLNRIYDPFFSTKFTGRGLGLAATLGIVRGHKGMIKVDSEVGRGTSFRVLLPKAAGPADLCDDAESDSVWQGSGQILLVDDEAMVLAVGKVMLEELGFKVLAASNGREAVELFKEHQDTIGQVVMDLTMPHMGGEEAFGEMRQLDPAVKVIITSGYNEQEITPLFAGKGLSGFIQKPFSFSALRKALGAVAVNNL